MKQITKELIDDIHKALNKGLTKGLGSPVEGEMCVEALICFKLGLPHSDNPPCVHSEVIKAKIALNDCDWSSNIARANGMRSLAIAQLGSISFADGLFYDKLKLNSTNRILPFLIQKHYDKLKIKDEKLLDFKVKFEQLVELDNKLWKEFYCYYYDHYYYDYYYYDYDYYDFYNYDFYNYNYYCYNYGDTFLQLISDTILQTLKELNSEGCKWL